MELHHNTTAFKYKSLDSKHQISVIWGHGWGHSHLNLLPIASSLQQVANHYLIDFPGFGSSPAPNASWGVAEYANDLVDWITKLPKPRIWVGHSFGTRIGLYLAAHYPELFNGLCLIAAAGIPVNSFTKKTKIKIFKTLKMLVQHNDKLLNKLRNLFGSTDYQQAGNLRNILIKVVNYDVTPLLSKVTCPTHLIYGEHDQDTPIIIGKTMQRSICNAKLTILPHYNHHSILTSGKSQLANLIYNSIKEHT